MNGASRSLALGLVLMLIVAVFSACGAHSASVAQPPHGGYYLALGDSLAAGYQTDSVPGDRSCAYRAYDLRGVHGYVCFVYWRLRGRISGLRVKDLGLASTPGEDSCSFRRITSCRSQTSRRDVLPFDTPPFSINAESQLRAALRFLHRHRERVRLITLDLGGNDLAPALQQAVQSGPASARKLVPRILARFSRNYAAIVHLLRPAAASSTIALVDQYNPISGLPSLGLDQQAILRLTSRTLTKVRAVVRRVARSNHALFVDVRPAFAGRVDTLTHILAGNVHPTARGYRLYGVQVWRVVRGIGR